ncbi:hypothetical protein J1614_003496 [Plenodomus biglobosus]|nr:hypothetical protein J1614_003496 [Plenodomus biglobosus]
MHGTADQGGDKHDQFLEALTKFMPHQMLMQTAFSIEYGKDPTAAPIIIREEMLRCDSNLFSQNCAKAKVLREQYAEFRRLLQALGSHLFPEVTAQQFEKERLELKVIPLLLDVLVKYPLKAHQRQLKDIIEDAVDKEIDSKNYQPPSFAIGPGGVKKKDTRDTTRAASLDTRLGFLKSRGVQNVAEQLYAKIHQLEKQERSEARTSALVAVAQNRILLPDTDDTTVQLLVQWIYHGTLDRHDASQTYDLMSLANRLGVDVLRELCLGALVVGLKDTLQAARVTGLPLAHLLGYGTDSANELLDTIFKKVFLENDSPERLKELVINAIADDLNMELWTYLKNILSHDLALRAMVLRGNIKNEQSGEVSLKMEENYAAKLGADVHGSVRET